MVVSGQGYRDPRTRKRYTKQQVAAAKAALGITPAVTAALARKGFGRTWAEQVRRVTLFRQSQGVGARRARKRAGDDFAKSFEVALQARDFLGELVEGYQRAEQQRGRRVTPAQALRKGSAFWTALGDLHRPRVVVRNGREIKVGKDSRVARALVTLGLRPAWATWRVGDSPTPEKLSAFLEREVADMTALRPEEYHRVDDEIRSGRMARILTSRAREAEILKSMGGKSGRPSR